MRDLHLRRHEWDYRHRKSFEEAIVHMIETKLVEWGDGDTPIFSEAGYNALTH